MKHITYADKSLLVDDETADCLMDYATVLGQKNLSDSISIRAVMSHGNEVEARFLLNASTEMMSETTSSAMRPPSNDAAVALMRERIDLIRNPPSTQPLHDAAPDSGSAFDDFP